MLANRQIAPSTLTQTSKWCNFCDLSTHNTDACFSLANAKKSNLECRQTAKQEKKQKKKDQKAQQGDTGAPPSPPEAEVAGSAFTVTSLSSHLSAHIASNSSYLWCTDSGLLHIWLCIATGSRSWNHTRFQLSWWTTVWCILRGLAQSFFTPKTKNYLPYFSLMYYMFLNFKTTSSQSSSLLCIMGSRLNHGNSTEILQDGQTDYDCHCQWETCILGWPHTNSGWSEHCTHCYIKDTGSGALTLLLWPPWHWCSQAAHKSRHGGWLGPHFRHSISCHMWSLHSWETA